MDNEKDEGFYTTPFRERNKIEATTRNRSLLNEAKISIILKNYDDMFSDFDPRHYSERSLSHDFLPEVKRAVIATSSGNIQLRLLLPKHERDISTEALIKQRLRDHFNRHDNSLRREELSLKRKGVFMILFGALIGLLATFLLSYGETNFFVRFIIILMEPASWFTIWEGFDRLIFVRELDKLDREFYKKMVKSEILFYSY